MTRLIDADALKEQIIKQYENKTLPYNGGVIGLIDNAPTVQREGWVSVPIEPTEEMINNAKWEDGKLTAINVYKLMLEAAPKE